MIAELPARYQVVDQIGRGGMSVVYKAFDTVLNRFVAVKFVQADDHPEFLKRVMTEAHAIALLSHPNIVIIHDVLNVSGGICILMEYVSGKSLEVRTESMNFERRIHFLPDLRQCADALDYAHRRGVIHRDVKPSNILLNDDGQVKLLDFGIAKIVASLESATHPGFLVGTPRSMAPEQITDGLIGPWTDQYGFAVTVYHLLTASYPFNDEAVELLLAKIATVLPVPPSKFNRLLRSQTDLALLRALSKNPADRFTSCREMFDAVALSVSRTRLPLAFPTPPARPNLASPWEPGNYTGMIQGVPRMVQARQPVEPVPVDHSGEPAPNGSPGEFTRLLRSEIRPPAAGPSPDPGGIPEPGEFTKMIEAQRVVQARQTAPPAHFTHPKRLNHDEPGDFTRLYRQPQTELLGGNRTGSIDPEDIAHAQSRELIELLGRCDFENAISLRGKWLPGLESASTELRGFSEAARYIGAAQGALSPHIRIEHLRRAQKVLLSVGNQLLSELTPASRHLAHALEAWKVFALDLLARAQQQARNELPNPFRAGQPLRPDEGRAVFRGRNALVRKIELILADAEQNSSLALLGPRRCGKTSVLHMLPAMLPDCACVFFDVQDNAASTVGGFFDALVRRTREQVRAQRGLDLPGLDNGSTFETVTHWFDRLDATNAVERILISIDEFERLESLFPGDRRDLLRLMGLFRGVIQHRHKVRLLVSGVAPFEELGPIWNDHFINVRELRIGHLSEDTSVDLLVSPIPEFPPDAVPHAVARQVFQRTAGQPYLLQLFGSLLINRLNESQRSTAQSGDVDAVEAEALSQGRYYLGNTYQDAPDSAREAMEALARGEAPKLSANTRRWLERRWIIDEHGGLRTPVLRAHIREELGIAETTP